MTVDARTGLGRVGIRTFAHEGQPAGPVPDPAPRRVLGSHAFLGVEQAVVLDTDLGRAREVATAHVAGYVAAAAYQEANMRRLGFGDEGLVGGPSRRLVGAIVAYGDVDAIRRRVVRHLDAGADHVRLQVLTADPLALPEREWRELAPALL